MIWFDHAIEDKWDYNTVISPLIRVYDERERLMNILDLKVPVEPYPRKQTDLWPAIPEDTTVLHPSDHAALVVQETNKTHTAIIMSSIELIT